MTTMTEARERRVRPVRMSGRDRARAWLGAGLLPLALGPLWVAFAGPRLAPEPIGTFAGLLVVLLAAACSYTDLLWGKIYNWATYPALLWALALNTAAALAESGGGPPGWLGAVGLGDALLGAGACFGVMLVAYRLSGGGAGDVKLAAAFGALLGLERGLNALILAYVLGAVVVVCGMVARVGPLAFFGGVLRRLGSWLLPGVVADPSVEQRRMLDRPVPLAAFFAVGALVAAMGGRLPW